MAASGFLEVNERVKHNIQDRQFLSFAIITVLKINRSVNDFKFSMLRLQKGQKAFLQEEVT